MLLLPFRNTAYKSGCTFCRSFPELCIGQIHSKLGKQKLLDDNGESHLPSNPTEVPKKMTSNKNKEILKNYGLTCLSVTNAYQLIWDLGFK